MWSENQERNQTLNANKKTLKKEQLFVGNLHSYTIEEDLYKLFGLRSTQYLQ